jgi:hypothetical protein
VSNGTHMSVKTNGNPENTVHRRRKYLIDPRLQLEVTGFFLGILLITTGVRFYWERKFIAHIRSLCTQGVPEVSSTMCSEIVERSVHGAWIGYLGPVAIAAVFMVVGGVLLSHRIAGPVRHLARATQRLIRGEKIEEIKFRKNDYFQETAAEITAALARLKGKTDQ